MSYQGCGKSYSEDKGRLHREFVATCGKPAACQVGEAMDGRRDGVALFRLLSVAPRRKPDLLSAWAFGLIATGVLLLVVFLYTAIISKMLPPSGFYVLDCLRDDWYYNLLVPLTIPTMVVAVYLHWLSMKLFKHA